VQLRVILADAKADLVIRNFHEVLKALDLMSAKTVALPKETDESHSLTSSSDRFWPWFKDCVGAIDGTRVPGHVPRSLNNADAWRTYKQLPSRTVLMACDFSLLIT